MIETVVALLMIVNSEIKEHRIQPSLSECLKGKRVERGSIQRALGINAYGQRQSLKQI